VVRRTVATAVFDILALAFLYFVLQDLAWRDSYAEREHLTPSTAYSLFIRTFSIKGTTIQIAKLVSPPALDWVQVIVASLIVVNGLYIFSILRRSPKRRE
jgi:hypothetical protein